MKFELIRVFSILLTFKLAGKGGGGSFPLGFFGLTFSPLHQLAILHNCSSIMKTSFDTN